MNVYTQSKPIQYIIIMPYNTLYNTISQYLITMYYIGILSLIHPYNTIMTTLTYYNMYLNTINSTE